MQLAGLHAFGPPADRAAALAVLREALEDGINHLVTADFYGPHVTNELIREALAPYPADLTIVTKVGSLRDAEGNWVPALTPASLRHQVDANPDHLGIDGLHVAHRRAPVGVPRTPR